MSTLPNRPKTAFMIIDVQNGVVAGAPGRDAVVANIADLARKARAGMVSVIWVRHENKELVKDSEAWRIVPELVPGEGEPVIDKQYGDAFEDTGLENLLAELGVGRLVIAGAQSDGCIRATLHGALVRGYDTILVADAHTTEDLTRWGAPPPEQVIAHTNMIWTYHTAPGRTAGTVKTAEMDFAAR